MLTYKVTGKPNSNGIDIDVALCFEQLVTMLKGGIVIFDYLKKDGSIRSAVGTLNPNLIPVQTTKEWEGTIKHLAIDIADVKLLDFSNTGDKEDHNIAIEALDNMVGSIEAIILQLNRKVDKTKGVAGKEYSIDKAVTYYDFTSKAPRAFLPKNLVKVVIP